jgi:serine/threonine protein kinase
VSGKSGFWWELFCVSHLHQGDTDWCYFVLEDGGSTLATFVEKNGPLSAPQLAVVAISLIRALEAIHLHVEYEHQTADDGQTHNDIKPTNILVGEDGRVMLIDMDVASTVHTLRPKKPGPVSGSYEWSGTDGLAGFGQSPKDDLDSAGQVLIWAATGKSLWRSRGTSPKDQKWRMALKDEKEKWRAMNWTDRAKYVSLPKDLVKVFQQYYAIVEKLTELAELPSYDALCKPWERCLGSKEIKVPTDIFRAKMHNEKDVVEMEEEKPKDKEDAKWTKAQSSRTSRKNARGNLSEKQHVDNEDEGGNDEKEERVEEESKTTRRAPKSRKADLEDESGRVALQKELEALREEEEDLSARLKEVRNNIKTKEREFQDRTKRSSRNVREQSPTILDLVDDSDNPVEVENDKGRRKKKRR